MLKNSLRKGLDPLSSRIVFLARNIGLNLNTTQRTRPLKVPRVLTIVRRFSRNRFFLIYLDFGASRANVVLPDYLALHGLLPIWAQVVFPSKHIKRYVALGFSLETPTVEIDSAHLRLSLDEDRLQVE